MKLSGWFNLAWLLRCLPERRAFRQATRDVAAAQTELLLDIVRRNRSTQFGRDHRFDRIGSPAEYQQSVPLANYEAFEPYVRRIADGQAGVLTAERVRLLEPTSGTTRGEKLIPYTATLRRQFQRAVAAWMADLLVQRPALRSGRAYWSISPVGDSPRRTPGGIPIGFDDDASYLGSLEQLVVRRLLVAPPQVRIPTDLEVFRYATLLCLLRASDLTLVSIWNPTFLTSLLADLPAWHERLCQDIRDGGFRPPSAAQAATAAAPPMHVAGQPRRSDELASLLRQAGDPRSKAAQLWPRLRLISCWTDAAAARDAERLQQWFAGVELQGKGLLATEGCVSFPLLEASAPVLAIRSAFFEFQPCESSTDAVECRLAQQLNRGGHYRVVLTTGGGLYRYQLHDEVRVEGFWNGCPLLRFLGKSDGVSDLVGEKLSEPHVRQAMDAAFGRLDIQPRFALLVPVTGRPCRYRLYLQTDKDPPSESGAVNTVARELAELLEAGLRENPHYRYAVGLRQLDPLEVAWLAADAESGWQTYQRGCLQRGQRLGDIKPTALDSRPGWAETFATSRVASKTQIMTT